MIVKKISIKKFRGFKDVAFDMGSLLTVIAGQNGTQKTTILGLLSQPFALTKLPEMSTEKPLSGGSFKSAFKDKFKFSDEFDEFGEHEWSLFLDYNKYILSLKNSSNDSHISESEINSDCYEFTVQSTKRIQNKGEKPSFRFWKKGSKDSGSGYVQMPVIYLSLKRLLPIGEDNDLKEDTSIQLTNEEQQFYIESHKNILIDHRTITSSNYLSSKEKHTLGANTELYDWKLNSAGQDNVGKLILAVLSFKRLQEKYPDKYIGGILAIDEIDTTLYPAAQVKLLSFLVKNAKKYNIQIICTTHSLSVLKEILDTNQQKFQKTTKVVFLDRQDDSIEANNITTYQAIKHRLNVSVSSKKEIDKLDVFTEDSEAIIFVKALLKGKARQLRFIDCTFGCTELIYLASQKKIESFRFPSSMIIFDGDVRSDVRLLKKANNLDNALILPSHFSPERLLAKYLHSLSDKDPLWLSLDPNGNFNKQFVFRDYSIEKIEDSRETAKKWFNENHSHKFWGTHAQKVIDAWAKNNASEVSLFLDSFVNLYNKFAHELNRNTL